MFDIISYFEDNEIEYHLPGEDNVSKGWVNIPCPYPECDDHSWHHGINLGGQYSTCWICEKGGGLNWLIAMIGGFSVARANTIMERYQVEEILPNTHDNRISRSDAYKDMGGGEIIEPDPHYDGILPKEMVNHFPNIHLQYLEARNFEPDALIPKYRLRAVHSLGRYKFRIIIPVIMKGRVVSFTARDVSGLAEAPYIHCPNDRGLIRIKNCLYNIDTVGDKVLVLEGATDVWRIGDGAVATFGMEFREEQVELLCGKDLKAAFVLFDSEPLAQVKAGKLAAKLSTFVPSVERLELPSGDPGDMNDGEVEYLRKSLGL